jgi:cystathionine beta-lyase
MKYDFDEVIERRNTGSVKWDNLRSQFGSLDVLPMWVADMDFRVPQPIVQAIKKRAEHPVYGYTLREGAIKPVTDRLRRLYDWQVNPEWVIITPGVVPAVNAAVRAFAGPSRAVVLQSPAYPPFWTSLSNNSCVPATNVLVRNGDRYEVDFDDLERKLSETGAKAMILCSPHNPVGRVWSREELERMGEITLRHGAVMISDEIHCELTLNGNKHVPFAAISPEFERNSITCYAPSKTFNIAGMHCSVTIVPDEGLRKEFNDARAGIMGSPDLFAVCAMDAAFRYGDEWLEQALDYIEANLEFMLRFFEERIPRIKPNRPEGTYLVWLDCRDLEMDAKALGKFFNEKAKVGLNDGTTFGPGGEGFQRMNIACARSILEEGLKRIEDAVNSL